MPDRAGRSALAFLGWPFVWMIRAYRLTLSHIVGGQCRFHPTCSRYAEQAFRTHNPLYAMYLTIVRLARCHPLGGSGFDPVPSRCPHPETEKSAESEVSVDLHDQRPDDAPP